MNVLFTIEDEIENQALHSQTKEIVSQVIIQRTL